MNKQIWIEHLASWKEFLIGILASTDEKGEQIKIERQLRTIERVRCGAVLNPVLLTSFIDPSIVQTTITDCDKFSLDLNDSQKNAVKTAIADNVLTLIQGPPGTGKTQVIAEICLQLYKRNPEIRILVCSETHVAVNNLINRIAKQNDQIRIVRIRDKENDDSIDEFLPETMLKDYFVWASACIQNKDALSIIVEELNEPSSRSLEKALILSANIAGMTCNRAAAYDFRDTTEMFDVVIIDEVCKATLPEILAPLIISEKAILLGDPKQLPPVFCSEEREIIHQIENCHLDQYMYIDKLFEKASMAIMLDEQYRMSNQIGEMISTLFYDGNLKNGRNEDSKDPLLWISYSPSMQWPTSQENSSERPQVFNEEERDIIASLVSDLLSSKQGLTIGIITPYKGQAALLKKTINPSANIKIDTVDGFQGKECDVVIFSVTRTTGSYRFLADKRRLNVALSRARDRIIIVGDIEYARKKALLLDIMNYCDIREFEPKI